MSERVLVYAETPKRPGGHYQGPMTRAEAEQLIEDMSAVMPEWSGRIVDHPVPSGEATP